MFRRRVKLRTTIAVSVLLITSLLAAALLWLNYRTSAEAVRSFTRDLLEPVAQQVEAKTQNLVASVADTASMLATIVAETPPDDRLDEVDIVGFAMLATQPELFYVQYGMPDGNYQRSSRQPDGGIESKRILRTTAGVKSTLAIRAAGAARGDVLDRTTFADEQYDPRRRPWYRGALDTPGVYITEVYAHQPTLERVISASAALPSVAGADAGVVAAAASLQGLTDMLAHIRVRGRPILAFVLEADGAVVACSGLAPLQGGGDDARLPQLAETSMPELQSLAGTADFQDALRDKCAASFAYGAPTRRMLAAMRPLSFKGHQWIVGAVIPEDDFVGEIRQGIARGAVVSTLIIGLFLGLAMLLANMISKPLLAIATETDRIRRLEFEDRVMPDTVFEEIADINAVYANLKTGLRGFQKYVPFRLVRSLLAEGTEPRLGGNMEELTLFFSDIRGFTSLAEGVDPGELATVLGDYLKMMAEIVADEGGTVDKFIGDAVMAFWNAPRPVSDHAFHAVRAAVRCRDAIAAMPRAELLRTRFGLNTATVLVGNFGAPDRLSYTALGDGVNLASRLEGVNTEYGTEIIVSDDTFQRLGGRFACRRLDRIAVKGKRLPTEIHEVLGETDRVAPLLLEAATRYEQGLTAYFERDFTRAATLFGEAIRMRPDDAAASLLLARAEAFATASPPADWVGVFTLTKK
jgi:adenylate cyclase